LYERNIVKQKSQIIMKCFVKTLKRSFRNNNIVKTNEDTPHIIYKRSFMLISLDNLLEILNVEEILLTPIYHLIILPHHDYYHQF